ncbi:DeoR/GlpR family DNA-binding transcription regulator [Pontibacillus salicampi]|uniref:DeoR/GlpR family DNA-binding transcription regulator n=1 Tax=Pontibacillus salicampi TaxID=1449801 RepID=A0ABV6LT72_9BACI
MLTPERQQIILDLLNDQHTVKLHELVEATNASESTIRRDLQQLEKETLLKRVHGGASILHQKSEELSVPEKSTQHLSQKKQIAELAASFIRPGDCIFIDAGTTTSQLIPFLKDKQVIVVTNGISLIDALLECGIEAYVTGGFAKPRTRALIGSKAIAGISGYRFDKCFIGTNGIHSVHGYTTPDPEEAAIKEKALELSQERYILADASKLNETTFTKFADIQEASIITDETNQDILYPLQQKTKVKVVSS